MSSGTVNNLIIAELGVTALKVYGAEQRDRQCRRRSLQTLFARDPALLDFSSPNAFHEHHMICT